MKRYWLMAVLVLAVLLVLPAQGTIRVTLDAGSFSFDSYEGALVLPHKKDVPSEILKAMIPSTSKDGLASTQKMGDGGIWTIAKTVPGTYSFYVGNPDADPGFEWKSSLKVSVEALSGVQSFTPPSKSGSVWHVFDIDGSDGTVIPVNIIYPFSKMIWGFVRDAAQQGADGKALPLEGVTVELYSKVSRTVVDSLVTSKTGFYMLVAPDGIDFTVTFRKPGFIQLEDFARFMVNEYPQRIDAAISSFLLRAQYRAVLSWGKSPSDLDSHLSGPTPDGNGFHISYRAMKEYARRHNLDVDCMSGFGPETITITRLDQGTYSYSVHDYSNKDSASSRYLSQSLPMVRLYREKELIATFACPENQPGTLWKVFEIDGATGAVNEVNTLAFEADPAKVR